MVYKYTLNSVGNIFKGKNKKYWYEVANRIFLDLVR